MRDYFWLLLTHDKQDIFRYKENANLPPSLVILGIHDGTVIHHLQDVVQQLE